MSSSPTSIAGAKAKVLTAAERLQATANRRARARLTDRIATISLWGVAAFITLVFVYIVGYTVIRGLPSISGAFLTSGDQDVGIGLEIFNTFYLLILSLIVMIPIGIGTAIYLSEYAKNQRFLSILRFATETMTSVPTLIIGLFGFLIFTAKINIIDLGPIHIHGFGFGYSRLAGALTLAVLNVPWMLRTAEDALRVVPQELREASLAMGATRWQTTARVVLPAAISGLVTSVLIVAGRVTGETAALIYTAGGGASSKNYTDLSLSRPGETLAYHAYQLFRNPTAVSEHLRLGTALVLIVIVLLFNILARLFGNFINRRFAGKRA